MPLTETQIKIAAAMAGNRSEDSYLAGGAAMHMAPNSKRYSADLDFFHDSDERVAKAFEADRKSLEKAGLKVNVEISQPGYIRAMVMSDAGGTKIEWAHDSAWRFMPPVKDDQVGYLLHPVDLAINKLLALVGRDEPRDFLDIIQAIQDTLPLGPLCWAAAGKDPGFTPLSILELLQRRGKYHPQDFERLHLVESVDLADLKIFWLSALESAAEFIRSRPPDEIGCLYYSAQKKSFVDPTHKKNVAIHYGTPGGVLPQIT